MYCKQSIRCLQMRHPYFGPMCVSVCVYVCLIYDCQVDPDNSICQIQCASPNTRVRNSLQADFVRFAAVFALNIARTCGHVHLTLGTHTHTYTGRLKHRPPPDDKCVSAFNTRARSPFFSPGLLSEDTLCQIIHILPRAMRLMRVAIYVGRISIYHFSSTATIGSTQAQN